MNSFESKPSGSEYLMTYRANILQQKADRLTHQRLMHSRKVGTAIGITRRNWLTFGAATYLAWTDLRDGQLAKKAQKVACVSEPLTDGHIKDPIADKVFRKELSRGMLVRAVREKDTETIAVLSLKQQVDARRDERMAEHRDLAEQHGISVAAIQKNRIKTATDMTGMLLHISPLAENDQVRRIALGLMTVGSGVGLAGEREYASFVENTASTMQIMPEDHDLQIAA